MKTTNDFDSIDPLDSLEHFPLDEANLLEIIDPNDLSEWVENKSDDASEKQDSKSIDPDDLQEWLEVMSCEDETALMHDLLKDDVLGCEEYSETNYSINDTVAQIGSLKNVNTPKTDTYSSIEERIAEYQKKLEVSMFKTELSRQQFLKKKRFEMPPSLKPSVLTNNFNDLITGKRKCLTNNLEESRKRLRLLQQPQNPIYAHNDFFIGKRASLTTELEESRNYLQMLGGLKPQAQRMRLTNCNQLPQSKTNSALMA